MRKLIGSAMTFVLFSLGNISVAVGQDAVVITEEQSEQLEQQRQDVESAQDAADAAAEEAKQRKARLKEMENAFGISRAPTTQDIVESYGDKIDLYNGRAYKKTVGKGEVKPKFPWQLKCTTADFRTFHGCLELRFFDPSARVYFDTGTDDPNEVDVFRDGNLNVTVDLVSIYLPWRLGRAEFYDRWSWGPVVGAGIGAAAEDPESGTTNASSAPVVLLSAGGMIEYKLESGTSFAFETGYSIGFSSDESLGDINDSAVFVGIRINVPIGDKTPPKSQNTQPDPN